MAKALYIGNLAPETTQEQLRDLFAELGPVEKVDYAHFDKTGTVADAAIVVLADDSTAPEALRKFNGTDLNGRRLAVSWAELPEGTRITNEVRQVATELGQRLQEDPTAQHRLERVVRYTGVDFARCIADEALEIEAAGGMMTLDRTRRRTPGGVFFYLVRGRISADLRREIFAFHKKKAAAAPGESAPTEKAPAAKPAPALAAKKASSAPAMPPVEMTPPAPPKEPTPAVIEQLSALRQAHQSAQQKLDAVRSSPPNQQAGLFSAIKAVLDVQKQIDTLLKEYPALKDS